MPLIAALDGLKVPLLVVSMLGAASAAPITIGPGPVRGTDRAGVTWFEDFQDWTHGDLKSLDDVGLGDATFSHGDGLDDSRDLLGFYYREESGNLYFRVDLYDLAVGAEIAGLDVYVAIDAAAGGQAWMPDFLDVQTDRLWELCLVVDQNGATYGSDYRMFDDAFADVTTGYLGSHFDSQIDAVEFGITKQALLNQGWDGVGPLTFQVFTAKDGASTTCSGGGLSSDITDALVDDDRGCSDGVLNGGLSSTDSAGFVYYASIAHGNQSVNQADDVGVHVYESAAATGISGGTGFQRTLDTHEIFGVPLNIHPSGTLVIGLNWAHTAGGASDPQDGPTFLARVGQFVDSDQSQTPGSLIGGVLAEHIMPYFEGAANQQSLAITDQLYQDVFGIGAAQMQVMHTPERVIRSQSTGLSPLDGHTFEDIEASPYVATYLDEVTHLHWWFHDNETCTPDAGYRHKVHEINGVYTFMINEREDGAKFGNHDGGMVMDTRFSLLQKALYGASSEIVVVFDDWEALAGKSFDPLLGASIPNNNPNQYHATIRWAANHPWIRISNLKDVLADALADPASFVIDHGDRFDLEMQTYEWLKHASEDSYNYWYYNENAGFGGNEQDFYDLVPVITGEQGDYFARGATPGDDGPPLPSGMSHGDLNSPGTLMYESWNALQSAPAGRLRDAGIWGFLCMIYETGWHEEDQSDYSDSDCYQSWLFPDSSWDGVNTWALRLQNHVRQSGLYAAAAQWAEDVRTGSQGAATTVAAADLDFDGEDEYLLKNDRAWAVFERYGGRCVLAAAFDQTAHDAEVVVGAPLTNPSAPGEEEYTGTAANRCSAFKDMNSSTYADGAYAAAAGADAWTFTSPDGKIVKTVTLAAGSNELRASYMETVAGPVYVRLGLSPNPIDLATNGHANLSSALDGGTNTYRLVNAAGGTAVVDLGTATWNASPLDAGFDRRNVALTEQVELSGDGTFEFAVRMTGGTTDPTDAPVPARPTELSLAGPFPSPTAERSRIVLTLPRDADVNWRIVDVAGRRVSGNELGRLSAGEVRIDLAARDGSGRPLAPGVYFVRVTADDETLARKWTVLR